MNGFAIQLVTGSSIRRFFCLLASSPHLEICLVDCQSFILVVFSNSQQIHATDPEKVVFSNSCILFQCFVSMMGNLSNS